MLFSGDLEGLFLCKASILVVLTFELKNIKTYLWECKRKIGFISSQWSFMILLYVWKKRCQQPHVTYKTLQKWDSALSSTPGLNYCSVVAGRAINTAAIQAVKISVRWLSVKCLGRVFSLCCPWIVARKQKHVFHKVSSTWIKME